MQAESAVEGIVIGILLRLLFGFDVSLAITVVAGVGGRVATMWLGAGYVAPDWWAAELMVCSGVTLAILGTLHNVRANW